MTKTKVSPRPKDLIVDDGRNFLQVFTISLSAYGATVVTAENGRNDFTIALTEMPDVIVTDYTMPGRSGEYLLGRLNREPETKGIPVIVLTGRSGAAAYLNKRVDLNLLLAEPQNHVPLCLEQ